MTFGSFDCEPRRRLLCSELPPRSIAGKRPMEPRARSFVRRQFRTLPGLRLFFRKRHTRNVSKIIIFGTTRVSPYIHIPEIQCSITVHTAGYGQPRRRGGIRSYKKGTLKIQILCVPYGGTSQVFCKQRYMHFTSKTKHLTPRSTHVAYKILAFYNQN